MIKKCKICYAEIETYKEVIGTTQKNKKTKTKSITLSDEGIFFEDGGCWFCNECWKEMTE